ncbi:hypothetical protein BCV70DRAFT_229248 [Testicularia cyperi]|uniref:Uncharacterized protein n=1 Tax=Testicularia cyperi TaxID=1882483 RepID=A0A317XZW7_9BASI|nr:hypothetical protein BCV70DRAFT_229248 [Testicularia cyperi]
MALRPDSIYRVDLTAGPKDEGHRPRPPKVIQLRLTEHAISELASVYSGTNSGRIHIDLNSTEPSLLIGDAVFPLAAPLQPSSSAISSTSTAGPAPNDLFRLSDDETTLKRVGSIDAKYSVKPTRDVSAAAHRLKQQREEEEHRKEERKRAVMLGASVTPSSSSSTKRASSGSRLTSASINNRNLITAKTSSVVGSSPLSRSASLNRIPTTREQSPASQGVSVLDRGSRYKTPGSPFDAQSYTRTDRAVTNSPDIRSSPFRPFPKADETRHGSSLVTKHRDEPNSNSDRTGHSHAEEEEEGYISDSASTSNRATPVRPTRSSSALNHPDTASDAKKPTASTSSGAGSTSSSSKLTTRQRLAKAAKGGSRILPASDRRTAAAPSSSASRQTRSATLTDSKTASSSTSAALPAAARDASTSSDRDPSVVKDQQPDLRKTDISTTAHPGHNVATSGSASDRRSEATVEHAAKVPAKETAVSSPSSSKAVLRQSKSDGLKSLGKSSSTSQVQVTTLQRKRPAENVERNADRSPRRREPSGGHPSSLSRADETGASNSSSRPAAARESQASESIEMTGRKRRRTNDFAPVREDAATRQADRRADKDSGRDHLPQLQEAKREHDVPPSPPTSLSRIRASGQQSAGRPEPKSHAMERVDSRDTAASARSRQTSIDGRDARDAERHSRQHSSSQVTRPEVDSSRSRHLTSAATATDAALIALRAADSPGSSDAPSSYRRQINASSDSPAHVARTVKGVGPGATHWSEPWLDVRSKSDWHKLAQRFAKTQEEYARSRQRLDEENQRLDREMALADVEERQAPAEPDSSLLFSPHVMGSAEELGPTTLARQTATNTALNSGRTRGRQPADRTAEDGAADESPEEGEMLSSDAEEQRAGSDVEPSSTGPRESRGRGHVRSLSTATSLSSPALSRSRSSSPENLIWRQNESWNRGGTTAARSGGSGSDRPLSYKELAERVAHLNELHGSLARMHRVLVDYKARQPSSASAASTPAGTPIAAGSVANPGFEFVLESTSCLYKVGNVVGVVCGEAAESVDDAFAVGGRRFLGHFESASPGVDLDFYADDGLLQDRDVGLWGVRDFPARADLIVSLGFGVVQGLGSPSFLDGSQLLELGGEEFVSGGIRGVVVLYFVNFPVRLANFPDTIGSSLAQEQA